MTTSKNIAAEWSVAYAVSVRRLDSQFMLCLLRLTSWPNLGNMHGDLVDDLSLICVLLAKRPMVGFLIARRLKLPVDKTFALLSIMRSKGHLTTLGAKDVDLNFNNLEPIRTLDSTASNKTVINEASFKPFKEKVELQNSGEVLKQLWRVLNTDIVLSQAAREKVDPHAPVGKEVGDVLSQLWQVLNADIGAKIDVDSKADVLTVKAKPKTTLTVTGFEVANESKNLILRDVNGQEINPEESTELKAKDLMAQLWSVLNTDIAFKRQTDSETVATTETSTAKTKEISEVMSQLWRVLNTEIAIKRQGAEKDKSESLSDTTSEANDKLSKLWRILDAEIVLKKKPSTYIMTGDRVSIVKTIHNAKKEADENSVDAVNRLSQFWNVLNSEIALSLPPEHRRRTVKRP